jgi:hypothetical protein
VGLYSGSWVVSLHVHDWCWPAALFAASGQYMPSLGLMSFLMLRLW